jgi:hypothetical protein
MNRIKRKILNRIAETEFVRSAIEEEADLSAFKEKPTFRIYVGLCIMAFSYIIGWPAVGALGALAIYFKEPLVAVIGGPVIYGISHLAFLLGAYLAGAKYTKAFFKWAARKAVQRLMENPPAVNSGVSAEKE